jgi:hypothetical protein
MSTEETIINKAEQLFKEGVRKFKVTLPDCVEVRRAGLSSHGLMLMLPKSKKYGVALKNLTVLDIEPIRETVNTEEKHRKQLLKAISLLRSSGLWQDNLRHMELALSIGYNRLKQANDILSLNLDSDYYKNQSLVIAKLKEFEPRLIEVTPEGKEHYNTSILWYMTNPLKIKKMNFGAYNVVTLAEIKEALELNKPISLTGKTSYDVSFEYNPEIKRAWYSEEFKGCGNGHYYLALNHEYAVYYEDD